MSRNVDEFHAKMDLVAINSQHDFL